MVVPSVVRSQLYAAVRIVIFSVSLGSNLLWSSQPAHADPASSAEFAPDRVILSFDFKNRKAAKRLRGRALKRTYRKLSKMFTKKLRVKRARGPRYTPLYDQLARESRTSGKSEHELQRVSACSRIPSLAALN